MKIEIEVSEENENTAYPWWLIIDPKQMLALDPAYVAMGMISGPFFSRKEAEEELQYNSHHYSKRAVVWCHSGHNAITYKNAIDEARKKENENENGN